MCEGECVEKQMKIRDGSLRISSDQLLIRRDGETDDEYYKRRLDVRLPTELEKRAKIDVVLRQHLQGEKTECKGEDDGCKCFFKDWGDNDWLPQDETDKNGRVTEKWQTVSLVAKVTVPNGEYEVTGYVGAKFRERKGICRKTILREKVAYIPEFGIEMTEEFAASLSEGSRELLKKQFA